MGKINLNAMKKEREAKETEGFVPEALEESYTSVWGANKEKVEQIELNRIHPFTDNKGRKQPFRIFEKKVRQIKLSAADIGIVTPLIVRKIDGDYQIISGHHRYMAAKELNLLTVPCIVREIDDAEVSRYVAECNIQRSKMLPTEYAEIYARYLDMRHDIDMTVQEIAEKFGISKKTLYRYVKILYLTDNLKKLIDEDMLHTDTAEIFWEFSYDNQEAVYEFVKKTQHKINRAFAKEIQELVNSKDYDFVLTVEDIEKLLEQPLKKACKNKLYNSFADKYSVDYTEDEWNDLVSKLLEQHFAKA